MAQQKGIDTRTLLVPETDIKTPGGKGFLIPIFSNTVKGSVPKNVSGVIPQGRDAAAPYKGYPTVSGQVTVPLDALNMGLHLRNLLGDPTDTVVAAKTLNAAAAVDKGSGKVGIPCTAHGWAKGAPVVLDGTTHYDGAYVLQPETSANEMVILASYSAETFAGTETATLARQVSLSSGAVVDKGGGLVGLPASGHGLPVGAEIVVAGTTNYNATYLVKRGTSDNQIVVTATYNAETLDGTETATARFWDHVFKVAEDQPMPSFALERNFATIGRFAQCVGNKIGSLSFSFGGDQEPQVPIQVTGCREDLADASLDAAAVVLPLVKFAALECTVRDGGVSRTGRITALSLDINTNLDTDTHTIDGDGVNPGSGELGDISEGILALSGSLTALFKDATLMDRAALDTVAPIDIWCIKGGYRLDIQLQETELAQATPDTADAKGMKETYQFQAYRNTGSNQSSIKATLRNEIKDMEE